jgi:hypothetical protein
MTKKKTTNAEMQQSSVKKSSPDTAKVTMVAVKGKSGRTRVAVKIVDMLDEEVIGTFALLLHDGLSVPDGIRRALKSLARG